MESLSFPVWQPSMTDSVLLSSIGSDHVKLVEGLVDTWATTNGQVRLITEDGESVWCGRMLLVMYSRMMRDLLLEERRTMVSDDLMMSISLPVTRTELTKVMELLQTGVIKASSQEECSSIAAILGEVFGVEMEQLEVEDTKPSIDNTKFRAKKRKPRSPKNPIKKEKEEVVEIVEVLCCQTCDQVFVHKKDLRKHMYEHTGSGKRFDCPECNTSFGRKDKLNLHIRDKHENGGVMHQCEVCDKVLSRKDKVMEHVRRKHPGQL